MLRPSSRLPTYQTRVQTRPNGPSYTINAFTRILLSDRVWHSKHEKRKNERKITSEFLSIENIFCILSLYGLTAIIGSIETHKMRKCASIRPTTVIKNQSIKDFIFFTSRVLRWERFVVSLRYRFFLLVRT